ncbi:hypothetical protein MA5S0422_2983 [Mycobacteroides abscessus 5S-0422]|uniref:Uncharacterized protein n=1 Tax=Mycobacteroides abscessus subsp. bolletii 1513 TaxID=1299321 RepID=X8DSR1_9MYCO|nr:MULTISPECIES: hypothetical protein [Mycobacteroides]EUA71667.1 hypothetical protein I540_3215 [Mycobacteroides abscessus subsp. bolletii 1513]EIU11682.1 hypothetical protein MA5S0304_2048 [Mycobacteroides abscessus 5S-0304]EIU13003.1 hypothetical protein MA5S0421_2303 [Mycobacteroides abscessus 5S-0421]EIU13170.1 hypothetical protein MA5S0422_2983 [Mycobacteroides abscessus 5S-0422]EIU20027.1 hypothetical protein MA5S0708_5071 [Mycobacteroides abscessus 5S-0708]
MSDITTYQVSHPATAGFTVTTNLGSAAAHQLAAAELRRRAGADVDTAGLTVNWSN